MKPSPLLLHLLLLIVPASARSQPQQPPIPEKLHLFLLVGQSNMAGRGALEPPADRTASERVLKWSKEGKWLPAVEPYHWDKPGAGAGLAKTFAEAVTESDPEITVGLIPAAVGGSPLAMWSPGAWFPSTRSHPYDDAIARARAAMASGTGTLKAILWHQGESDCVRHRSLIYEEKLRELITRFRHDLGDEQLPFFIGQLGRFPEKPWTDDYRRIDEANQHLAQSMTHVWSISAEGLPGKGDKLHFNTEALRLFGRRYAEAYLRFTRQEPGKGGK